MFICFVGTIRVWTVVVLESMPSYVYIRYIYIIERERRSNWIGVTGRLP